VAALVWLWEEVLVWLWEEVPAWRSAEVLAWRLEGSASPWVEQGCWSEGATCPWASLCWVLEKQP
jgi:hypothetical protein